MEQKILEYNYYKREAEQKFVAVHLQPLTVNF